MTKDKKIPAEYLAALALVRDGADVHSYALAKTLRQIEREFPALIRIGPLMMYQGDGTDRMPYFGAIATADGKRALRAVPAPSAGDAA